MRTITAAATTTTTTTTTTSGFIAGNHAIIVRVVVRVDRNALPPQSTKQGEPATLAIPVR